MAKISKRYRSDIEARGEEAPTLPLEDAIAKLKQFKTVKFDQSVEICLHLGVDPKHADQIVRGAISLPNGTGKTKRVIAFCGPDAEAGATEAGALEVGGQELVKKVADGWMDFDVAVASPDMMRFVGKLGRVLGPRGLMPSPKAGTVTPDVATAVAEYTAGKVNYKTDTGGNVHAVVGKFSFSNEQLVANTQFFIDRILKEKPSSTKGQYVKRIAISGTMTPSVYVEA